MKKIVFIQYTNEKVVLHRGLIIYLVLKMKDITEDILGFIARHGFAIPVLHYNI